MPRPPKEVHETPLIIFPPWINKFYILDLKAQNSLIRWITDQGYTLFVVSWINPDAKYKDVGMEEYIEEGYLTAIREVKAIYRTKTGQRGRLLHRGYDAGLDAVAVETARRQVDQVGHLLYRADRFFRSGRIYPVPARRLSSTGSRPKSRTKECCHPSSWRAPSASCAPTDLIYTPGDQKLHDGRGPARLRSAVLERRRGQPARENGGRISARSLPAQRIGQDGFELLGQHCI